MHVEANRLLSFSTWPESSPVRPADLARAGLYYVGPSDRVACFYCSGVMRDWEEGDVPAKEHERHFSTCAFAMGSSNTGNIPLAQAQQASFLPDTQNSACSASPMARTTRARNPEMHSVVARLATYQAWPSTANVAAQPLATAGFYYTGHGDNVKCFHCDGGLRNWEQGDNPWYEHGKWFPRCAFLLQQKGEAFVNEIMRQHPQLIDLTVMYTCSVDSVVELVTDVLNAEEEEGESPKKSANYVQALPPEEELKRLQEQHTCKVCMDKEVSVVFIPCGHLVVCRDCASSLRKCPICRAVVRGTVRTFMS
ncbi:unnamed protein product [Lampetra fluviatilis]